MTRGTIAFWRNGMPQGELTGISGDVYPLVCTYAKGTRVRIASVDSGSI
jgi:hypothetical protein